MIGEVERVKTLKSLNSSFARSSEITSLTGRPGMRYVSEEKEAVTRVKLGKHVASMLEKSVWGFKKPTFVRLG
jgi:hypothetical protein